MAGCLSGSWEADKTRNCSAGVCVRLLLQQLAEVRSGLRVSQDKGKWSWWLSRKLVTCSSLLSTELPDVFPTLLQSEETQKLLSEGNQKHSFLSSMANWVSASLTCSSLFCPATLCFVMILCLVILHVEVQMGLNHYQNHYILII